MGETLDELMKNVKEVIQAHIEAAKKGCKSFSGFQEIEVEVWE